jgi:hypothetical protein
MGGFKTMLGLFAGVLVCIALVRRYQRTGQQKTISVDQLFSDVKSMFTNANISVADSVGCHRLDGAYAGHPVQLQTIVDTLAVRKLPSLWMMVTLPCALPISAKLDMMMRPAGVTSFSNFDFLDHTLDAPKGFPEFAVLRSDKTEGFADIQIVKRHIRIFANPRFKELLITPQGLRLVVQVAEASRSHYGVFREARFGDVVIDRNLTQHSLETLLALKAALEEH